MATHFSAAVVGGVLVGSWLEKTFGIEPWGTVGGSVLGMAAGIHGLIVIGRKLKPLTQPDSPTP